MKKILPSHHQAALHMLQHHLGLSCEEACEELDLPINIQELEELEATADF
jgi:hypothetical protein